MSEASVSSVISADKPLPKGMYVGQTWSDRAGNGPTVRLVDIDLEADRTVNFVYIEPSEPSYPVRIMSIGDFVKYYRPGSRI